MVRVIIELKVSDAGNTAQEEVALFDVVTYSTLGVVATEMNNRTQEEVQKIVAELDDKKIKHHVRPAGKKE